MIRVDCIDEEYMEIEPPDFEGDIMFNFFNCMGDEEWSTYLNAAGRKALVAAINELDGKSAPPALQDVSVSAIEACLNLAAKHENLVEFRYAKANGALELRRLWVGADGATTTRDDHKIVVGWDPDRDEPRSYRLDRMPAGVIMKVGA